jgi:hypothetical protein
MGGPDMAYKLVEGGIETDTMHIFKLLGWRYSNPLVPVDASDPSGKTIYGAVRKRNLIDRAVWPENFVHVEDGSLSTTRSLSAPPVDSEFRCVAKIFVVYRIIRA